jgi:Rieske Fe-S protein
VTRRFFVGIGLALAGLGRRAWAQIAEPPQPIRYARLARPVRIPLSHVATPWQPVPFVAEGADSGRRVLISGVLFRRAPARDALSALCVTCPHEQCQVDLITDRERLARLSGADAARPVFECGCHLSVFDAANEGARISGETPRGLYRFRIGDVRDDAVVISEVEAAALSEV